jgi:hypothetical protein
MIPGKRYRVSYLAAESRSQYVLIGTYLGEDAWGARQFDCRPHAGTQTIPSKWRITEATQTTKAHEPPAKVL